MEEIAQDERTKNQPLIREFLAKFLQTMFHS